MRRVVFHVSEDQGIERFEPRPAADRDEPVVWAIDAARLRNYLLPRDCPRVTYYAGIDTTTADAARFLGSRTAVVAIEDAWIERLRCCRLYCYTLPADTFQCIDETAGYFVSRVSVVPIAVELFDDVIAELAKRGVELRTMPSLWPLRDAVVASTLAYSIIRMRNAQPRLDAIPKPN